MHDQDESPTGKRQQLTAGEDPRGVAYRLTRESWQAKAPDFNRRLNYQPLGLAMKKPQAFSRCGYRALNCSVLKSTAAAPGAFNTGASFYGCGVENAVPVDKQHACRLN